ncbi:hypothetical protein JCM18899A_02870 [Nocardioides sp. AN3]
MHDDVPDLSPCLECGHPVYPLLVAPIFHAQHSCRAVVDGQSTDERCGCTDAVHRLPTIRPRHRLLEPVGAAS